MLLTRPLTWLLSVLLLGLALVAFSGSGIVTPLRELVQAAVTPVQDSMQALVTPVAEFVSNVGSNAELRRQNQQLRATNERLTTEVAQLQEQAVQSNELANLARVEQQQPTQRFLTAGVVARDPSAIHDRIEIDHGSQDGLRTGMLVLGAGGALIGTVREVLPNRAWVQLLSDAQSNVNVLIQQSRAAAILRGSVDKRLSLEFVQQGVDVKIGDTVLTSGLGGEYPEGLLIGHVSGVQGQPLDLFKQVSVEPAVRLDNLEHVLVMTSFTPVPAGP